MIKDAWEAFLDALYPPGVSCNLCGRNTRLGEHGLCADCVAMLQPCAEVTVPEYVDEVVAGMIYDENTAGMVHRFKYGGGRYMGGSLASFIQLPEEWLAGILVPVPLYREREQKRGYNQSRLLADSLSTRYGVPVNSGLLMRTRDTGSQARMSGVQRRENLINAFRASKKCRGQNIILVDDVLTTGSTASACAKALKDAGAERVFMAAACHSRRREQE